MLPYGPGFDSRRETQPMKHPRLAVLLATFLGLAASCGNPPEEQKPQEATPPADPTMNKPAPTGPQAPIDELVRFAETQKVDKTRSNWKTTLTKPPMVAFPTGSTYFWNLATNAGDIKVRLMPDVAPMHVSSTIYLTKLGFYDGLAFHRVIPGFMAQGGCPLGTGTGGPGYEYAGEFSPKARHDRGGLLSMANRGGATDGSQFFLTFAPTVHLNDKHTIFGEVVGGMETLKALEKAGSQSGKTSSKLEITRATITVE